MGHIKLYKISIFFCNIKFLQGLDYKNLFNIKI